MHRLNVAKRLMTNIAEIMQRALVEMRDFFHSLEAALNALGSWHAASPNASLHGSSRSKGCPASDSCGQRGRFGIVTHCVCLRAVQRSGERRSQGRSAGA